MTKIRLFIKKKFIFSKEIEIDREKEHYLRRVMRKKDGDKIYVFNEEEEWIAKLSIKNKFKVIPIDLVRKKKTQDDIWLCFSLIKSKNINYLIEKITEIGVKKIIPIITEYSERFKINHHHLEKIMIEAVEQSNAIHIPRLEKTMDLKQFFKNLEDDRKILFCDERREGLKISDIQSIKKNKIAILVGPVGGWSDKDINIIKNKNVLNINLGKNILKADTAAIVSLSMVKEFLL